MPLRLPHRGRHPLGRSNSLNLLVAFAASRRGEAITSIVGLEASSPRCRWLCPVAILHLQVIELAMVAVNSQSVSRSDVSTDIMRHMVFPASSDGLSDIIRTRLSAGGLHR